MPSANNVHREFDYSWLSRNVHRKTWRVLAFIVFGSIAGASGLVVEMLGQEPEPTGGSLIAAGPVILSAAPSTIVSPAAPPRTRRSAGRIPRRPRISAGRCSCRGRDRAAGHHRAGSITSPVRRCSQEAAKDGRQETEETGAPEPRGTRLVRRLCVASTEWGLLARARLLSPSRTLWVVMCCWSVIAGSRPQGHPDRRRRTWWRYLTRQFSYSTSAVVDVFLPRAGRASS